MYECYVDIFHFLAISIAARLRGRKNRNGNSLAGAGLVETNLCWAARCLISCKPVSAARQLRVREKKCVGSL